MPKKMITLTSGDIKKEFSIKQAENILYIQSQMKSKCWKLEDDSPYEYIDNAFIKRASKENCNEQAPIKAASDGSKARRASKVSHSNDT